MFALLQLVGCFSSVGLVVVSRQRPFCCKDLVAHGVFVGGRSLVCVCMCLVISELFEKPLLQSGHLKGFSSTKVSIFCNITGGEAVCDTRFPPLSPSIRNTRWSF